MYCQIHHGPWTGSTPYTADHDPRGSTSPFAYFFPEAPVQAADRGTCAALDALADAMMDQGPDAGGPATIAPFFVFFAQFIDHDILAGTDGDQSAPRIDSPGLEPRSRATVRDSARNLRTGRLSLDSVYGNDMADLLGSPTDREFAQKLTRLLRCPDDRARMRLGRYDEPPHAGGRSGVEWPADRKGDLPRLAQALRSNGAGLTVEEMPWLSDGLREVFLDPDGRANRHRAVIADTRNDEHLVLSQIHLAVLRLHNAVVDSCRDEDVLAGGPDARYEWARDRVRWIYQWQVINSFLPAVCDPQTLARVMHSEAALYRDLFARSDCAPDRLPLPIEFSAAAFRFGHALVQPGYDWNGFYGCAAPGQDQVLPSAPVNLLFAYSGTGRMDGGKARLPARLGPDWARMLRPAGTGGGRIGTRLARPMAGLAGRLPGLGQAHVARRNLRRGHLLNLPSAQDCIAGLRALDRELPQLTPAQMGSGPVRAALEAGGWLEQTPLWYYVLREAEVLQGGQRLGPLGTHLVAQTLLGLVVSDPDSYWHKIGSDRGRWRPLDLRIDGVAAITDIGSMLATAGLCARLAPVPMDHARASEPVE